MSRVCFSWISRTGSADLHYRSGQGSCSKFGRVFGLADAPMAWYERLLRTHRARGWAPPNLDEGLFYNWSPTGVLEGVTLTHMDDILVTGKEAIKSSHENLLRKRTEPGETYQWGGYGEYDRVPPKPPDTGCL